MNASGASAPAVLLLSGAVAPLGASGALSGIAKRPVDGPVMIRRAGMEGDGQADLKHHGGPDKALHHYAREHYALWRAEIGPAPVLEQPGAFGENLSTAGLTEADVAVGDVFRLGRALVEVSQGRQPCWKLNWRFAVPDMARRVQRSGRTGWHYRVLEEGHAEPGDTLRLMERRAPDWPLTRLWRALYVDRLDPHELHAMAALEHLPEGWRRIARRRLEARRVEDWTSRLDGPNAAPAPGS